MNTILLTGGTGLIGQEYIKYFVKKNYRIVTTFRNEVKFNKIKSDNLIGIKIENLLSDNAVDEIISKLKQLSISPEILINNACDTTFHKMEENGFATRENMINQYKMNVILPYELSFKLVEDKNSKLERIINISSMYGVLPYNPHLYDNPAMQTPLQYSISKAGLIHLTKELAIRYANKGILVNCISYGGVDGRVDDEFKERFAKLTPLKTMMSPQETISPVEFLLNDKNTYMTGHNLIYDGGRCVW